MALDLAANAVSSLVSLLWVSLVYSIPVFLAYWFIGKKLHSFFQKRLHRSWAQSAFLSSYVVFFLVLILAFFFPVAQSTRDNALGVFPQELRLSLAELAFQYLFALFRLLAVAALFALFALPLVFIGTFAKEWLADRVPNKPVHSFFATWLVVVVLFFIALFLVPWVVPGLIYLVYWG